MIGPAIAEARLRIAALFPRARDASGSPYPEKEAALPVFAVTGAALGAERQGMGDATAFTTEGEVRVGLWVRATSVTAQEELAVAAEAVAATLLVDDLGGTVWSIVPASAEIEIEAGEGRIARLDLVYAVEVLSAPAIPSIPAGLGLT